MMVIKEENQCGYDLLFPSTLAIGLMKTIQNGRELGIRDEKLPS